MTERGARNRRKNDDPAERKIRRRRLNGDDNGRVARITEEGLTTPFRGPEPFSKTSSVTESRSQLFNSSDRKPGHEPVSPGFRLPPLFISIYDDRRSKIQVSFFLLRFSPPLALSLLLSLSLSRYAIPQRSTVPVLDNSDTFESVPLSPLLPSSFFLSLSLTLFFSFFPHPLFFPVVSGSKTE